MLYIFPIHSFLSQRQILCVCVLLTLICTYLHYLFRNFFICWCFWCRSTVYMLTSKWNGLLPSLLFIASFSSLFDNNNNNLISYSAFRTHRNVLTHSLTTPLPHPHTSSLLRSFAKWIARKSILHHNRLYRMLAMAATTFMIIECEEGKKWESDDGLSLSLT